MGGNGLYGWLINHARDVARPDPVSRTDDLGRAHQEGDLSDPLRVPFVPPSSCDNGEHEAPTYGHRGLKVSTCTTVVRGQQRGARPWGIYLYLLPGGGEGWKSLWLDGTEPRTFNHVDEPDDVRRGGVGP